MKVTVCQIGNFHDEISRDWDALIKHVAAEESDLLLLPEMTFSPWFAESNQPDDAVWESAVESHESWLNRLAEANVPFIAGTRPVNRSGKRVNEAFWFTPGHGIAGAHQKYYLPDEEGFWEATWYGPGDGVFETIEAGDIRAGFLICTEMWFMERARKYGQSGARFVFVPRCTPDYSGDKWLAGGRSCAVVSGAYCLSSNRQNHAGSTGFGGLGWIIDPEGEVLATTSGDKPFVTVDIDLKAADAARKTYPRYVKE